MSILLIILFSVSRIVSGIELINHTASNIFLHVMKRKGALQEIEIGRLWSSFCHLPAVSLYLVNMAEFICKELGLGDLRHLLQLQHSKCFYKLLYI